MFIEHVSIQCVLPCDDVASFNKGKIIKCSLKRSMYEYISVQEKNDSSRALCQHEYLVRKHNCVVYAEMMSLLYYVCRDDDLPLATFTHVHIILVGYMSVL